MQNKINRRTFIQYSALGTAGMVMMPSFVSGSSTEAGLGINYMGGITPVSVIDSACMLAFRSGKLSQESQRAIITDIHLRDTPGNKGRLAMVLSPCNPKITGLCEIIKNTDKLKHKNEKLAIVFGWVAVNAVYHHINPVFKNKKSDEIRKIRMHQDAVLMREFSKPQFDITKADPAGVEHMLLVLHTRTTTRVHTLKPDSDDGIGWVNRMAAWRRDNKAYMEKFARIMVNPDDKIAGSNFYHASDKIIEAANKLQKAENVKAEKVIEYTGNGASSGYGKALAEATTNILAIDDYLKGNISLKDLSGIMGV